MKEKTRKYLVLGQGRNDDKPFICYRTPNFLMLGVDKPGNNGYSAENCLCSKKEARRTIRMLSSDFPEITYGIKQFLA
jgi:hypothetical protein